MSEPALTTAELDELARSLAAADDLWVKAQGAVATKLECPDCGGRGSTGRGSLGDICDTCDNTGQIDDEFGDDPLPFPAELTAARTEYKALRAVFDTRDLMLRGGASEAEMPALPPASAGAELAAKIAPLRDQAKEVVKKHREATREASSKQLRGGRAGGGHSLGTGSLGGGRLGSGGGSIAADGADLDLDADELGGEGG